MDVCHPEARSYAYQKRVAAGEVEVSEVGESSGFLTFEGVYRIEGPSADQYQVELPVQILGDHSEEWVVVGVLEDTRSFTPRIIQLFDRIYLTIVTGCDVFVDLDSDVPKIRVRHHQDICPALLLVRGHGIGHLTAKKFPIRPLAVPAQELKLV